MDHFTLGYRCALVLNYAVCIHSGKQAYERKQQILICLSYVSHERERASIVIHDFATLALSHVYVFFSAQFVHNWFEFDAVSTFFVHSKVVCMRIECGNAHVDDDDDDVDYTTATITTTTTTMMMSTVTIRDGLIEFYYTYVTHIRKTYLQCSPRNFQFSPIFFSAGMNFSMFIVKRFCRCCFLLSVHQHLHCPFVDF